MTYQAEARVVCRIYGSLADVKVGGRTASKESHLTFNAMSITRRLFNVPVSPAGTVPDNDMNVCRARAEDLVQHELPAAYTIDSAAAIPILGHAWRDGRWVPTNPTYSGYAFPIQFNSETIEDEVLTKEPTGPNLQTLILAWFVVVQPR